jgi:hypothetical protein
MPKGLHTRAVRRLVVDHAPLNHQAVEPAAGISPNQLFFEPVMVPLDPVG